MTVKSQVAELISRELRLTFTTANSSLNCASNDIMTVVIIVLIVKHCYFSHKAAYLLSSLGWGFQQFKTRMQNDSLK